MNKDFVLFNSLARKQSPDGKAHHLHFLIESFDAHVRLSFTENLVPDQKSGLG
jgi:hypothetical protein